MYKNAIFFNFSNLFLFGNYALACFAELLQFAVAKAILSKSP